MDIDFKKTFEKIYEENADALFRFVIFRVSEKQQAKDIVQETFIKYWQAQKNKIINEQRAFIFKIARNLVIDWYKKSKSINIQNFTEGDDNDLENSMDMFTSDIMGAEIITEVRIVKDQIASLDPIYREVVYLRYVEELSPKEITLITGQSANVVSVRINRGIAQLKAKFYI